MTIIHNVTCDVGGVRTPTIVKYEIPQGGDVVQLVHDAALDYCLAECKKGNTLTEMTYADFVLKVPNTFCAKHGFEKELLQDTAQTIDGKTICLSHCDLNRQLRDQAEQQRWMDDLRSVFYAFGRRMEPVLRKTSAVFDWTYFRAAKQMLTWAEEFANANNGCEYTSANCEREFVTEKLEQLKRQQNPAPTGEDVQ